MQRFLQPILPFIQVGFNMEARSRQISAHNAAKSYMLNAFIPESEIDYSKVLVSFGNLGDNVHTWIAFISDDRQRISMST